LGTDEHGIEPIHGTTLKVYRFIYRQGRPVGVHEIQKALGMASSSTAHYHVQKLLADGLVRSEENGYVVDRVFFENFVRIRKTVVPIQLGLAVFFATSLAILLVAARPPNLTSSYIMGVIVCVAALFAAAYQTLRDSRGSL
jgi:hypothetical protein